MKTLEKTMETLAWSVQTGGIIIQDPKNTLVLMSNVT